jgi:hypothetical protein
MVLLADRRGMWAVADGMLWDMAPQVDRRCWQRSAESGGRYRCPVSMPDPRRASRFWICWRLTPKRRRPASSAR